MSQLEAINVSSVALAMPVPQHDDVDIDTIIIGERHRKDLGDVSALAASIKELGLFNPITITTENNLIAGERRLRAFQLLGWSRIPVRRVDIASRVRGEYDENEIRKDFTPSEKVAILAAILPPKGGDRVSEQRQNFVFDKHEAASKAGFGNYETARQAKSVVASDDYQLIEAMDTGKVSISNAAASVKLPEQERTHALSSEDPNRALREAVVAMASVRPSTPSNRNPIYKPDAQFNALAAVTGYCDSITEKIKTLGTSYLAQGVIDEAMKSRVKATIARCIDSLKKLSEEL